jgi:hypothetical protein
MQCPHCGNPDMTSKFCTKCGASAPAPDATAYDPSYNPYESMARQRAEVQAANAPEPRPVAETPPSPIQPEPLAQPPEPPRKKPGGYQPSMGENFRSFIMDPATFFKYNRPRTQLALAIIMFFFVNVLQAGANFFFFGVTQLSHTVEPRLFLLKAVFTAAYPLGAGLIACLLLAARGRAAPDFRSVLCIYSLGFFPYVLAVIPLPMTVVICAVLSVLHLRAGFAEAFELEPAWLWIFSLGAPLAYWIAAGAVAGFEFLI